MADNSGLERHVKKYVIDRVPNPFLDEGLIFKLESDKLLLATAVFDGKVHAELSAAGKDLAYLTPGGIADYYKINPLPNTYTQIEVLGYGEISLQSRRLELNMRVHYLVGPKIFVSDNLKTTGGKSLHPPTVQFKAV